jgi:hypothetical protein
LLGGLGITGVASAGVGGSISLSITADMNDIKSGTVLRNELGRIGQSQRQRRADQLRGRRQDPRL